MTSPGTAAKWVNAEGPSGGRAEPRSGPAAASPLDALPTADPAHRPTRRTISVTRRPSYEVALPSDTRHSPSVTIRKTYGTYTVRAARPTWLRGGST